MNLFSKPFHVSISGRCWKLLQAERWFQRHFKVFQRCIGGLDPCYDDISYLGKILDALRWWKLIWTTVHVFKPLYASILKIIWSFWGLEADLDNSFRFPRCFTGGLDPCYDDTLGRFWVLLRGARWFERHFHVFFGSFILVFRRIVEAFDG